MAVCNFQSNMTLKGTAVEASSYIGSLNYMKKIIPTAVSNILAKRVDFQDNLFNTYKIEEVSYQSFSSRIHRKHPLAPICHAIAEAAELLEKKMIKRIVMVIRNGTDSLPEYYQFTVKHLDNEKASEKYQKSFLPQILDATVKFMENINMLESLKKLPPTVKITIESTFNTSLGLDLGDLKYFKKARLNEETNTICDIKIAAVQTNHHSLMLRASRSIFEEEGVDAATHQTEQLHDDHSVDQTLNDSVTSNKSNSIDIVEQEIVKNESDEELIYKGKISCICKVLHPIKNIEMVRCPSCEQFQHVVCLGHKKASSILQPQICFDCSKATKQKYKDVRMARFKFDNQRRALALIRLLSYANMMNNISPDEIIKKISPNYITKSVKDIQKFGIITMVDEKFVSVPNVMKQLIDKYFYKELDSQTFEDVQDIQTAMN